MILSIMTAKNLSLGSAALPLVQRISIVLATIHSLLTLHYTLYTINFNSNPCNLCYLCDKKIKKKLSIILGMQKKVVLLHLISVLNEKDKVLWQRDIRR